MFLLLYCVRLDHDRIAETHLFDSRIALSSITANQREILASPRYRFAADENATGKIDTENRLTPILDQTTSRLLRFDIDTCRPIDDASAQACDALKDALLDLRIAIRLKAGHSC